MSTTSEPPAKKCKVFSTSYRLPRGTTQYPEAFDWDQILSGFKSRVSPEYRRHKGIYYDPVTVGDSGRWLLTMHRPINQNFMSLIGPDGEVRDVDEHGTPIGELAYSSCALFADNSRCVALLKGHHSAPGRANLEDFLTNWTEPGENGARWRVSPTLLPDQIDILRKSQGALGVDMRFERAENLLADIDHIGDTPLSSVSTELRDELESDLTLRLDLNLANPSQQSQRKLKEFVLRDFGHVTQKPPRAKVKVINEEGAEQVLDLISEHLTVYVDISTIDAENVLFQELALSLEAARGEINDAVGD